MTQTAAAHIITADAIAMGDPEIIIMGRVEDGEGDRVISRFGHLYRDADILVGIQTLWDGSGRYSNGWRPVGDVTSVERGYWIVNVERV